MKKCPQCGNDIPLHNKTCNHCGYSSESINKSYAYGNVDGKGKSSTGKIILIVVLCVIFGPFLFMIPVIFFIVFSFNTIDETESKLNQYENDACSYVCKENSSEYREINDYCYCSDGNIYDKEGFLQNDEIYDSLNIHLAPLDIKEWINDISLDEGVVTVLCESDNYSCEAYTPVVYTSALKNGYKLYIFNVDQLNTEDRNYLLDRDVLKSFNEVFPFTFVVKENQVIKSKSGIMYEYSLETFLEDTGLIEESY